MDEDTPWEIDPDDPVSARRDELPATQRRFSRFSVPSFRRELGQAIAVLAAGGVLVLLLWFTLNAVLDESPEAQETTTSLDVATQWRERYEAEVQGYHDAMAAALAEACDADLPESLEWISARAAAAPEPFAEWAFYIIVAHETAERAFDVCTRNPEDGAEGMVEATVSFDRALDAFPAP